MHPTHQIRRIVTGHDDAGKAIIESDGICPHVKVREGAGFVSSLLWVTDETPARVDLQKDRAARTIGVPPPANGSILRVVDFPPVTKEAEAIDQEALLKMFLLDRALCESAHEIHLGSDFIGVPLAAVAQMLSESLSAEAPAPEHQPKASSA